MRIYINKSIYNAYFRHKKKQKRQRIWWVMGKNWRNWHFDSRHSGKTRSWLANADFKRWCTDLGYHRGHSDPLICLNHYFLSQKTQIKSYLFCNSVWNKTPLLIISDICIIRMDELFLVTKWNLLNREVLFCALNNEPTNLEEKLDELLSLEMKHIVRKSNRLVPHPK